MIGRSEGAVAAPGETVLFFPYVDDVATHAALSVARLEVGSIATPFYAPKGESRLVDPDRYILMVAQV